MMHVVAVMFGIVFGGLMIFAVVGGQRLTRSKARFAILGAMLASALGFILAAVSFNQKTEAVWQPDAIVWSSSPVRVAVNPAQYPDGLAGTIVAAAARWNSAIGCEAVRLVGPTDPHVASIVPTGSTTCAEGGEGIDAASIPASTWYCHATGTAEVETRRLDDIQEAYRIFLHELGHVLGLAHDPTGPMAPEIDGPPTVQNTWPSNKDVAALRARYCR